MSQTFFTDQHEKYEQERKREDHKVFGILAICFVLFIVFPFLWWLLVEPSFVSDTVAYRTAEGSGFTDVQLPNREQPLLPAWSGCDSSDLIKFTMKGLNPAGGETVFTVCASPDGSGTIHF